MLNTAPLPRYRQQCPPPRQAGAVMIITLIIVIAMTLAGMALVRSVFTTNLIAGNLAFQQSAVQSGDAGTEAAIVWLENNNVGTTLFNDARPSGYVSSRQDPTTGQSWDQFWTTVLVPGGQTVTLPIDGAGNTVSYTIQRLCNVSNMSPTAPGVDCAQPQSSSNITTGSKGAGAIALQYNGQIYYRITSRVVGPRNTISFIQTIVAL